MGEGRKTHEDLPTIKRQRQEEATKKPTAHSLHNPIGNLGDSRGERIPHCAQPMRNRGRDARTSDHLLVVTTGYACSPDTPSCKTPLKVLL